MPKRSTSRWKAYLASAAGLLAAGGLGLLVGITEDQGRIFPGVSVSGIPVGGLTRGQAERRMQARLPETGGLVAFAVGGQRPHATLRQLGIELLSAPSAQAAYQAGRQGSWPVQRWERLRLLAKGRELPVRWTVDERRATRELRALTRRFARPAIPATARLEGGKVRIIAEQSGRSLDLEGSLLRLHRWLLGSRKGPVALAVKKQVPQVIASELASVNGRVARFSTSLSGTRSRRHNIALAARAIDGRVLKPGETFSYNQAVGRRTEENGFRTAPVLIRGELVPGTGGGVCQVSSTLYNLALLANQTILRRSHHSHPVAYLPPGRDATVVWGVIDLKFRNDTPYPLVLQAGISRGRVRMSALGHRPFPKVSVVTLRSRSGKAQPDLTAGSARPQPARTDDLSVTVLRIVEWQGERRQQVISTDRYQAAPEAKPQARRPPAAEAKPPTAGPHQPAAQPPNPPAESETLEPLEP